MHISAVYHMAIVMNHNLQLLVPQLPTIWPSWCTTACHYWSQNYLPYDHRDVPQPAIICPTTYRLVIVMYHSLPLLVPQLPTVWSSWCTTACHYWSHNYLPYCHRDLPQPAIIGPTTNYRMAIVMYYSLPLLVPQLPIHCYTWTVTYPVA
jgi:hypothetical protein